MSEEQAGRPRRRRSRAEAAQLVAQYDAGGMSREEFCRKHGLALSALARYLRRREHGPGEGGPSRWLAVELSGVHTAESEREPLPARRPSRPHPGRQELPAAWLRRPRRRESSTRVW